MRFFAFIYAFTLLTIPAGANWDDDKFQSRCQMHLSSLLSDLEAVEKPPQKKIERPAEEKVAAVEKALISSEIKKNGTSMAFHYTYPRREWSAP